MKRTEAIKQLATTLRHDGRQVATVAHLEDLLDGRAAEIGREFDRRRWDFGRLMASVNAEIAKQRDALGEWMV